MRNVVRREYLLFFLRGLYIGFEPGITHGQVHGYRYVVCCMHIEQLNRNSLKKVFVT